MASAPAAPAMATSASTGPVAYDVPADKIWPVLSSWSGIWLTEENSPAAVKDAAEPAVGATRKVYMLDGSGEWGEEITAIDAEAMSWTYKLTSALLAPFDGIDAATFACRTIVLLLHPVIPMIYLIIMPEGDGGGGDSLRLISRVPSRAGAASSRRR
jgi:hypothetical protein